jgi:hypothetical protein
MTAQTPVQRFAYLDLLIDRYKASGQPVPNDVANEYQTLRSRADAVLTPQQGTALLREVRVAQQGLLAQESHVVSTITSARQQSQAALGQALRNAGARQVSRVARLGRDGKELNEQQLAQALKTGGKWTQHGRVHALDAAAQRVQKQVGFKTTPENIDNILKQYGKFYDDPALMSRYLDQEVGPDDMVARANLEQEVRETYLRETLARRGDDELRKTNPDAFKPKTITMTDQERRKLDVADRIFAAEGGGPEFFVDKISDESLADTGRRGDTARAFAAHDDDRDEEVAEQYEDAVGIEEIAEEYGVE